MQREHHGVSAAQRGGEGGDAAQRLGHEGRHDRTHAQAAAAHLAQRGEPLRAQPQVRHRHARPVVEVAQHLVGAGAGAWARAGVGDGRLALAVKMSATKGREANTLAMSGKSTPATPEKLLIAALIPTIWLQCPISASRRARAVPAE